MVLIVLKAVRDGDLRGIPRHYGRMHLGLFRRDRDWRGCMLMLFFVRDLFGEVSLNLLLRDRVRFYINVGINGEYLNSSMTTSFAVSLTASFASSRIFIINGVNDRKEKLFCDR